MLSRNAILAVPEDWNHGCSKTYDKNGKIVLDVPGEAKNGDLLLLFLSRTDDFLPLRIKGWKYAASCFKSGNEQKECWTRKDCLEKKEKHCIEFPRGNGRDLATIIFYKAWSEKDPSSFEFYLPGGTHPGWGFLLAVNGVDDSSPVRDINTSSRDDSKLSVFPTVQGDEGDLLLLSMAFDDTAEASDFRPPNDMELVCFVNGKDEAGFLYSNEILSNEATGSLFI